MPLPSDPTGPTSRLVDLNELPVISRKVSPIDRGLMDEKQAGAFQQGTLQVSQPEGVAAAFVPAGNDVAAHNTQALAASSGVITPLPSPTPPPPTTTTALPLPQGPEIRPTDPPRYQERLNSLFGQRRSAEEKAERLERQLAEVLARLDSRASPPSPTPFTNQYGSFPGQTPNAQPTPSEAPPSSPLSANPYLTRAEVFAILEEQRQLNELNNAHLLSRLEAEKQYPDVFGNANLKSLADEIWDRDRALRFDPHGPEKAALLARAISYNPNAVPPSGPPAPPQVRKEQISAIGPSIPAGNESADDRNARYLKALELAQRTNNDLDYVTAMLIRDGKA